ncbi:hypothetical protein GCM10027589_13080 [Actinocorallia lasiicapitis]
MIRGKRWQVGAAGVALALFGLPGAGSAAARGAISAGGPLTRIEILTALNCQYTYNGVRQFFGLSGRWNCGTVLGVGGTVYTPQNLATIIGPNAVDFTPVSQTPVTGTGTAADPFTLTTVVNAGATGLSVNQVDSYVDGDQYAKTVTTVVNSTAADRDIVLYRYGDCLLQGVDRGYGAVVPLGTGESAIACTGQPGGSGQVIQFTPLTTGSHYLEDQRQTVMNTMKALGDFPDTCACATEVDNAAGLSWRLTVPAGESVQVTSLLYFQPGGVGTIAMTKEVEPTEAAAGQDVRYTVRMRNDGTDPVALTEISDTLPDGLSYVAGSSQGVTTDDPDGTTGTLVWRVPVTVPPGGQMALGFKARISDAQEPGTYFNTASGRATGNGSVQPAFETAPVEVLPQNQADLSLTKEVTSITIGGHQ